MWFDRNYYERLWGQVFDTVTETVYNYKIWSSYLQTLYTERPLMICHEYYTTTYYTTIVLQLRFWQGQFG